MSRSSSVHGERRPAVHHQILQDPPNWSNERNWQEGVEESDTNHGGIRSDAFEAPDLYAHGGPRDPDDEHDHWTSEPLQASQDLQSVSFWWKDQGWGNRKGTLFLRLVHSSPTAGTSAEEGLSREQENGHRQLMPDFAEHEWTRVEIVVYPEDPLRRLARAGDRYCLSYVVGGGGGHVLHAKGLTLDFGGITRSDEPFSRVLWKLDLGSNNLNGPIPQELADLKGLGLLGLDNNSLSGTVPVGLGRLEGLRVVDLTANELDVLPMDLAATWALAIENEKLKVDLEQNPWTRPPASVMSLGLRSAERWWRDINRFGEGTSNKLKMVLVGLAEAGKTTIVRHLTGRDPPDERTIGVEVTEWKPRDDLPLSVSLWDFAGQADYYASHHIFLTKGALFILVVDLFELVAHRREGIDDPRGAIFRWLDILHERVPGAAVALVGTHTGKFLPPRMQGVYRALLKDSGQDDSDSSDDWPGIQGLHRRSINALLSNPRALEALFGSEFRFGRDDDGEHGECQDQLAKAEELCNSLVQKYLLEKTKELSRSIAPAERDSRARAEEHDGSRRAEETRHPGTRGSFQRVHSTRGGPSVPLIIHENLFRANLLPESVDELSTWVVDAAAGEHSSKENKFSFPAVNVSMSSAWVDAIAAVEALGKRKGAPYVMWGEAVEAFQEYFQEQHNESLEDAAIVLQSAMEHREAEGAVILSLQKESSSASDGMIHLDPRWLIELVRRVTDHNLVAKSKQSKIRAELRSYCDTLPPSCERYSELWDAHTSFIKQGRLDREYLRFLWLYRTLEGVDGHSGVELDDESFDSMLATMIKCLFIYSSHSLSVDGREWFVVPARLPEYGNEKVLENKIWFGEVVVQSTATFQRTHAPRGIIGRFLAFSSSKITSSGECWQHGAHIRWEKGHEVLVCETFIEEGGTFPGIAICVKGSTAEAICVREDVKQTLKNLIKNDVHGYPGLERPEFNDSEPIQSNEFQRVIRAYLDIKFASLAETLEKISRDSHRMFHAAFPSSRNRTEYPRLVVLVPDEPDEDLAGNTEGQTPKRGVVLLRETWDRWMQLCDSGRRSFHLVFLCEHDLSEVPCGPEGKGYPIKDLAQQFKTLKPLLQAALWLVKIAVGVVANVDLPLHDMMAALVKATAAELVDNVAGGSIPDRGQSVFNADAKHTEGQKEEFKDLHGPAYESLCAFMRNQEIKERAPCFPFLPCLSRESPSPDAVDWRDQMVEVDNGIGGWAWVLQGNEEKYRRQNGSR